jgi:hypothetical protein
MSMQATALAIVLALLLGLIGAVLARVTMRRGNDVPVWLTIVVAVCPALAATALGYCLLAVVAPLPCVAITLAAAGPWLLVQAKAHVRAAVGSDRAGFSRGRRPPTR